MQEMLSETLYSLAIAAALIAEGIIEFRYFYKKGQDAHSFSEAFQTMRVVVQLGTLALAGPPLWWFSIPWVLAIGLWTWANCITGAIVVYVMIRDHDDMHQEIERVREMGRELCEEILKFRNKMKPSGRPTTSLRQECDKQNKTAVPVTVEYTSRITGDKAIRVDYWGIRRGYTYLCAPGAMDAIWKYHNYILQGNKGNQTSSRIGSFLRIIRTAKFIEMRNFNGRDILSESYRVPADDEGYVDYAVKYHYFSDIENCWMTGFMGLSIHEGVGDTIDDTLSHVPLIHNVTELFQSANER